MGRTTPPKKIHTSPETAGPQNMAKAQPEKIKDHLMERIIPMMEHGLEQTKVYKGLWTEEQLKTSIQEYFEYCREYSIKSSKASLRLWLGCEHSTYWDWEHKPEKHGYKTTFIRLANDIMEANMINRIETYPTGNMFLLKTSHGHYESSRVDITSNGQTVNSADEVKDLVNKLGLDKEK
jgi:hypothetical protein